VSTHGVTPSRATPRGRLILTTPQILGKVAPTEGRSPLNHPSEYLTPTPQEAPPAVSVEALHSNTAEDPDEGRSRRSHIRESADHRMPDQRPVLTLNTMPDGLITSPLSADFAGHGSGGPAPIPQPRVSSQNPTRRGNPAPSSGLRRASAQIYSPDSPSRRGRRQSVDVQPPQIPESSHGRASRRMSAPLDAAPPSQYSIPLYPEENLRRSGYSVENMRSDITQPSLSGTPNANKYPTVMPSSREQPTTAENALRLLGLPPPTTPAQLSYPRDPYSTVSAPTTQSNYYVQPREETRRTRRSQGGDTSRSKDHKTRTTRP